MKQNYIIIILIFLILFLIYINPIFLWNFKKYIIRSPINDFDFNGLKQENLILKTKLTELKLLEQFLPQIDKIIPAFVYSKYPFNLKNELLVKLPNDNFNIGQGVVLINNLDLKNFILIGKIKEIHNQFAVVQTIFDPNFKLSVKSGNSLINGLLVGGLNPKITLIPRNANIEQGDIIINAQPELPYGLIIGSIFNIK
ncbi:MAG: hypothetical protein N2Z85_02890, partial [Patescibacteria group bacterium]|nr:hypothetical protein [Patescibacteria group bacterium]